MHGGERGCDAVAVDAATVVTIPASAFEEMLHASPATLRTLAANFARIIRLAVVIDGYKLANLLVVSSLSPSDIAPTRIIDNLARGDGSPPPALRRYRVRGDHRRPGARCVLQ